jgi:hypothetical protein
MKNAKAIGFYVRNEARGIETSLETDLEGVAMTRSSLQTANR